MADQQGDVHVTVADGITGAIIEICKTIQSLCALGMTSEGQATLAYWRADNVAFREATGAAWDKVTTWVAGIGGIFK